MIPVLLLSACGPSLPVDSGQLPTRQIQESPTLIAEPTAAAQSTPSEPQVVVAKPAFDIRLTAVRSSAIVIRSGEVELEIPQEQVADIQVDDGIKLANLDGEEEQSYSVLDFSDYLELELFSNTSLFLADLKQGEDSTHVTLHLEDGHTFVHLNEQADAQVIVKTPLAMIRVLSGDAEFDVCHNEGLTCVFVKKGVVEITAREKTELVKVGEAIQILRGQAPSAPICAPISKFTEWEESYRQFADTPALDQELSQLPQEPCPTNDVGLPVDARILYQDQFINPFSGWAKGKIDNFNVRYAGLRFYRAQAQGPEARLLAPVPQEPTYEDVNIDVRAIAEAPSGGDFRYGTVFRRTGDQYYAFVLSPVTKTWSFLKSSSAGLETLREGKDERIHGLDSRETLRVEAYGSTFLVSINGRLIDWIDDPDYASGEVGLFVETFDNPDAQVRFDSIVIWDMQPVVQTPNQGSREYCLNGRDDDGDRRVDRFDPDCQRFPRTPTPLPQPTSISNLQPTNTSLSQPTNTSIAPNTPIPHATNTSIAPNTSTPPQSTKTPRPPTRTPVPQTNTPRPPTRTRTPIPATPTDLPPTDIPPTDIPPTDIPPTDLPPTDIPPTDIPPTDPPTSEPPPTEPVLPTDPPTVAVP